MTQKQKEQIAQSPFNQELMSGKKISVNGSPMQTAYWNLILSIRDVSLYSKGIKPHRLWKITDVKRYFGVSGSAIKIATLLRELQEELTKPIEEEKEKA
jgi:hypothetical protein